jgi:hypothetical protein
MTNFVPLPLPHWLSLATRVLEQDTSVVLERYELGWIRHALCPLNVPCRGLETVSLCAAEAMRRLVNRPSARRMDRIAHATAAGFLDLNGYTLRIPAESVRGYRLLLGAARTGELDKEELARWLAAHAERKPQYVKPVVPQPRGLILFSAPVLGTDPNQLGPWFEPLASAVEDAGTDYGLELHVTCPALVPHGDPRMLLKTRAGLLPHVDGQIIIGFKGDTTGGGHEQILLGLGRPWRWLRIGDAKISASLGSWEILTGGRVEHVATPEEAAQVARDWVASERRRLALSIYRRETAGLVSYRVHVEMRKAWLTADAAREQIADEAGVSAELIDLILGLPGLFSRIPLETLEPIAASMGVAFDTAMAPRMNGMLEQDEETALRTYVRDRGLDGETSLRLRGAGARLSALDRRRMGLGMPDGWEILHRGLSG